MRKIRNVQDKVRQQANKVAQAILGKLRVYGDDKKRKQAEFEWTLLTYSANRGIPDEYGIDSSEHFDERVARFNAEQMKILGLRMEGKSNREIGRQLNMHHNTVDKKLTEMAVIFSKEA